MDNKNNQQKLNKKAKRKQFWNYGLLFFGLFGVTATTSYFLIPSKKATVGGGDSVPDIPSSSSDNMKNIKSTAFFEKSGRLRSKKILILEMGIGIENDNDIKTFGRGVVIKIPAKIA